ncbi:hypothetical protein JJ685_08775 [Ramlibacter monticola]|uniref:Uncharacterized protein n=1 Tax=Ramlibacter monticola TaxID=1926872 RepID=A0A936YZ41_9BURK|nr:BPSL0761 family protein [Ramlibacter monticola]MBL0391229.1 hypothetical protein [Ramlibacter monticola]
MTTPEEHRRNLGWTRSMLQDIADHAPAGSELRDSALNLLAEVPDLDQIARLNDTGHAEISAAIDAIEAAYNLFTSAGQHLADAEVRRAVAVTLRHYPLPAQFAHWRKLLELGAPMGDIMLADRKLERDVTGQPMHLRPR